MLTKKSAIKALFSKHRQIAWFVGIYFASLLAFGAFHWLSQWFIHVINSIAH